MKIVSENSEILCVKEMELIEKSSFGYRALFIKLSSLTTKKLGLLRSATETLSSIYKDNDAKLFIFNDYDMLIVYQGMSITLLDSVYEKLNALTQEDVSKITQVFDLAKNISIVKAICNKKIELVELEKQAHLRSLNESANEKASENLNPVTELKLDEKLLSTLSERRNGNVQTKILVIEDDAFSRRLVKNILSKEFDVVEAEDGKEALLKYVTQAPNIVFLDINLPDCSGMALLEKLISIDKRSYVVMLSGNAFKDNILLSIQKGAKGFVGKPFPKEKIFHYIDKYKEEKKVN